jgi:capsular exopolysaccharide synthesis family protein
MELRRYLAIVLRWWWLLALGTLSAAVAAFLVSRSQTPVYEAEGTILVNQAQAITGPTYNDVLANQQLSKTYSQLVTSGPVLEQVGQNVGLSYERLEDMVSAQVRPETQLIDIRVRSTDPELAARVANETARVFAAHIRQAQLGQQSTAESDLEKQVVAVQTSIDEKAQLVRRLGTPQPGLAEDQRQQQLAEAQAQLSSLRDNLAALQRRLQELRIDLARSINSVSLANPARVPTTPVSPRVTLNTILGAVLGLFVVGCIVAIAEYLDDTVKTVAEVNQATGAPTLGAITRFATPRRGRGKSATNGASALALLDGRSSIAEAYRMVRTNLEFARSGGPNHTMLITSALPGEGKSTTAANLARVLAQTGRRVILVDADLRRPTLHRLFELPNSSGLSTLFVMDDPDVGVFLQRTPVENLLLLPSGPLPPNPAELLSSRRMGEIIAALKDAADLVVFDSPPLLGVADAAALAAQLDGVVLVVDSGRTRANALTGAADALRRAQATIWGVVLNKLKAGRGDGYYYYYPYYEHRPDRGRGAGARPASKNSVRTKAV